MSFSPPDSWTVPDRWAYGDAGDRYPVNPAEVWTVGPHTFACADLNAIWGEQLARETVSGVKSPALLYVDPPWNQGNAKAFRTKSGVPGDTSFIELIGTIVAMASQFRPPYAAMEMGKDTVDAVEELWQGIGYDTVVTDIVYYRTKPCKLILATLLDAGVITNLARVIAGADDDLTPGYCIEVLTDPGDTVWDCCLGRGTTALSAATTDRAFVGSELSPRRMAVALDKVATATGLTPTRRG
jgi:hypothetical protein